MKKILYILMLVVILTGCKQAELSKNNQITKPENKIQETQNENSVPEINEPEPQKEINQPKELSPEENVSNKNNENSNTYEIFGGAEFDTVVTGYLKVLEEEAFDQQITAAYFVVTNFEDNGVRNSIAEGIERGNSVNRKEGDFYLFNLGCFENNEIKGNNFEKEPYLDKITQNAILKSSAKNQISLNLHFGYHNGTGCLCCNLAHNIRLVE
jgi:hypothetical protein